ncbi:UNVERIFIED_CONTAM: U-box domain-containing protein 29 [Sesamum latifolium]|uniref:U-box domain-containing protein n=1 Tax=Sesamum latifolium TaxID=2727402 RepID=A0AAW2X6R4_9LAMI
MVIKDDLYISVPSYFRCPISLDVMKSPVSLCTGVTYDRSSIQRWLDGGNNTCPATMQVLHSKELIPNHTLQRLIKIWSDSVLTRQSDSSPPPPDSLSSDQARELVRLLENDLRDLKESSVFGSSVVVSNLSRLVLFAGEAEENGRSLGADGGRILPLLVACIGKVKDLGFLEKIVLFCNVLIKNLGKDDAEEHANALKSMVGTGNCDLKAAIMMGLKQGKLELRIAVARFLELMAARLCLELHSSPISEDDEIYSELLRLITTSDLNPDAMDASLSFLTRLVVLKRNRVKMIRAGGVKVLTAALSQAELSAPLSEKVLKLLEMSSGCKEGRNEICTSEPASGR